MHNKDSSFILNYKIIHCKTKELIYKCNGNLKNAIEEAKEELEELQNAQ